MRGGSDETLGAIPRRLWAAMGRRRRRQFLGTLRLMAVASVAELVTIGSLIPLLAVAVTPERADRMIGIGTIERLVGPGNLLPVMIACLIAASLAGGAIRLALLKATNNLAFGFAHDVGTEIFRRTLRQPYLVHASRNPSEVIAGLDKVNVLAHSAILPIMQGLVALFLALSIVLVLALVAPLATLLAAALVGAAYLLFGATMGARLRGNSTTVARMATARTKALREGLAALRDILLGQTQAEFEARFARLDIALRRAQAQSGFVTGAPRVLVECGAVAVLGLVMLYFSTVEGGLIAVLPMIGALGFGVMRILPLVNTSFVGWSLFAGNRRVLLDVLDLLQTPMVAQDSRAGVPLPFEDGLTFEHVSLAYPGRGEVLHDVSFHIPHGGWTALSGPTGSGKSSLLDLVTGLVEPSSGIIRIGRVPLDASTRSAWQAMVAHVPQQVFLSDGPIAANIAFGMAEEDIDMARVREAADRAQLGEFIASLPDGLDTPVGDAGIRISGGQRQRIAIARAFYRNARLLILDEATGQLDHATEQAVIEGLRRDMGNSATVLVVTHNPAVVAHCDRAITLDHGRVVGPAG